MTPTVTEAEAVSPAAEAFVADRQAFWGSFTRFVTMGTVAIVVLLILMAFFLG